MKRLYINPITRTIEPKHRSTKAVHISRGDHNSVLLRFEIPQMVDGFDVSKAKIQIHYANVSGDGLSISKGMSDAIEVVADNGTVAFAWKIPKTATRYAGVLSIGVTFERYDEIDGKAEEVYSWSTTPYGEIVVCESYDHSAETTDKEYDHIVETCNAIVVASLKANFATELNEAVGNAISSAEKSEENAQISSNTSIEYAQKSKSYAVGQTDTREGEEYDNAQYYCTQAHNLYDLVVGCSNDIQKWHQEVNAAQSNITTVKTTIEGYDKQVQINRELVETNVMTTENHANNSLQYAEEAKSYRNDAEGLVAQASTYAGGAFESERNAKGYAEESKAYADASYRMKGEVKGTGAVRLDFVTETLPNLVVNTSNVKSYGKNLVDFKKGTSSSPFNLGYIDKPMVVTAVITTLNGTVGVQKKDNEGNWAYISPRFNNSGIYTPSLRLEAGYEYRVNGTSAGFASIDKLQLELGDKATSYEEYISPVNGVKTICPTTTLIANNPDTEITATYNKDIGLVVADLEEKIATLEDALAKA